VTIGLAEWTDAELLQKSEAEITQAARNFAFDIREFEGKIRTGEDWNKVILSHLYIDHIVSNLLLQNLANPKAVEISRIGFEHRLNLADAMRLLPERAVGMARKINALRNGFAHNLKFAITARSIQELRALFTREEVIYINTTMPELIDVGTKNLALHAMLVLFVVQIEQLRQNDLLRLLMRRQAEAKLRIAVDNLRRAQESEASKP
jgi:hypothetical protein